MDKGSEIEFANIVFPSDGLTIKTLRRHHPDEFDKEKCLDLEEGRDKFASSLSDLLYSERATARGAFNRVLGIREDDFLQGMEPKEFHPELVKLYTHYGIASGPHHAEQVIRGIESQAEAQAHRLTGHPPETGPNH